MSRVEDDTQQQTPAAGDRFWLAGIWAAAALFFWPILFGGRSLYFRDTLSHYIPQALLTARAWAAGTLPLWEPRLGLGYPLLADPHAMALYPPALVMLLLPFPRSYDVLVALHVPLAGTFMFMLLRRWRCGGAAAALGAAVVMFSGYTVTLVSLTTLLKGLTWMPAAVLAWDRWLEVGSRRWLALTALALAVQGAGTDPQYVLFTAVVLGVTPFLRPEPSRPSLARSGLALVAVGALAGGLLAFQYLPLAELIGQSDRAGGLGTSERSLYAVEPLMLLSTVVPMPFPDPAQPLHLLSFPRAWQPMLTDLYLGGAVIALAVAALGWARGAGDERSLGRTALVAGGIALGGALMALGDAVGLSTLLVRLVPPLKAFRFASKYWLFVGFAAPVLAALGLEGVSRGPRACRAAVVAALAALALAAGAGLAALAHVGLAAPFHFLDGGPGIQGDLRPQLHELVDAWRSGLMTVLVECGALALVGGLALAGRVRPALFAALLALVAAGELATSSHRGLPTVPDAALATAPASAGLLTTSSLEPARFATYLQGTVAFRPQHTARDDVFEFRGLMRFLTGAVYGANPLFVNPSVRLRVQDGIEDVMAAATPDTEAKLLERLGVRYFVGREPVGLGRVKGSAGGTVVEELPAPLPRAFVPRRATPSVAAATPTTAAILALADDAAYDAPPGPPRTGRAQKCALVAYENRRVQLELEVDGPALAVVLDADYPGWTATVDGQPRAIHRVAGLFRGVEVERGDRVLEMRYEPRAFRLGAAISALAVLITLGLLVFQREQSPIS